MKAEPTDIDRDAARLFVPAPGMRAWRSITHDKMSGPSLLLQVDSGCVRTEHGWSWLRVCALDTDDPATVGVMLAQVEDAAGESVEMVRYSCLADAVWTCDPPGASGRTRGAAIVAAMKAIKADPTR